MLLNPYLATTGVGVGGGGGPTYFFEERFEPTGYTNSWTEAGTGTIDEDMTSAPLEGSQSLRIAATAQTPTTTVVLPSDEDELWAFFRIRVNVALSVNRPIFIFRNSVATTVGGINLVATTNQIQVSNGTTASSSTVDSMTTGSNYNIWLHWVKGTGSDGVSTAGFSATGTEPTSGNTYRAVSTGVSVTDAHDLRIGIGTSTTGEFVIDQILLSTTGTIGDSPA